MGTSTVQLSLACADYDRTAALRTGQVTVEGADLTYLTLPVEETFFRMVRYREFDVAELSLSTYVMTLAQDPSPFVAIPVYPSRMFRHSGIYVNADSGIERPEDLVGRVVGVPEYQVTAAVWIRGILAEHHGVPVDAVRYRTGGLHTPGRTEKLSFSVPDGVEIAPIPAGATLAEMLAEGEVDALYTPRTPAPFTAGDPRVRRLFPDSRATEQDYFARTGIFPIMHVVVIRRDVYEAHRWLARSLTTAFERSRALTMVGIDETASLRYTLPWLPDEVAATRAVMGADYWTYGLPGNEGTLETFLRYSFDQGLADRAWSPRELFAPETLEGVVV
ncbi:4,5-dihydroxyphthalate decarboxylase [Phycicoccus duodecadis]|uniref:4,5-dihydroxyphthalate decarboxylase n=1 Tax=Phycicoccus duodecadis TaxID=173053 RepID=A0A2N3YF52_9MICO|nr:4,5-dihydroxyphthalate decarboxylase [Phycicoccus duodecadis]PKW25492.1 4,5-dihydroxyphthalate decarboxylase [Phycicoccus duodecadis]